MIHPAYKLIEYGITAAAILGFCALAYKNPLAQQDLLIPLIPVLVNLFVRIVSSRFGIDQSK
jgi:hypothetical protein